MTTLDRAGTGAADRRPRAAVLGTGLIGQDLVQRLSTSAELECALAAGRRADSPGLLDAAARGVATSVRGVDGVLADPEGFAVVFDATSAEAHRHHWPLLRETGALVIDLTPSHLGSMYVPGSGADPTDQPGCRNVNLVSCGGQAAVPIARALTRRFRVEYLEAVSTVASRSAGPATRDNIDDYVRTTTRALEALAGVPRAKAALIVSPANPPATFRTSVHAIVPGINEDGLHAAVDEVLSAMRRTAPGYQVPTARVTGDRVLVTVSVAATGGVLPPWAGNLELIDAAAISAAERLTRGPAIDEVASA